MEGIRSPPFRRLVSYPPYLGSRCELVDHPLRRPTVRRSGAKRIQICHRADRQEFGVRPTATQCANRRDLVSCQVYAPQRLSRRLRKELFLAASERRLLAELARRSGGVARHLFLFQSWRIG